MNTTAIILAAGRSSRMKSRCPKPLMEICGRPMLQYILRACFDAGCERVLVVVGFGKEQIKAGFEGEERITWVEQAEPLGTADAVRACRREIKKYGGDVLVLPADGPLVRGEMLRALLAVHREEKAAASVATAIVDAPDGYRRILRTKSGDFESVIEDTDCTAGQREITEVSSGHGCMRADALLAALPRVQGGGGGGGGRREQDLSALFAAIRQAKKKVIAVQVASAEDVLTVNTRQQQAEADAVMEERIQRKMFESGVSIVSPVNTYIEDGTMAGADTVIRPFTFIGRDCSIGADCVIGPFACLPPESIVTDGSTVVGGITERLTTQ